MAESDTATSLAGVGIFFQQDCDSNEVFVKTIVKGGSADRSGVLRVGDVVVRVNHENVVGQPLSSLRSCILGGQGSQVTLGFRRQEGSETTFYDVPLVRGSPEYFESLRTTQPLLDEIERMRLQTQHLEAQVQQDALDLQRFRQHMEQQRLEFDSKLRSMDDAIAQRDDEIERLRSEAALVAYKHREAEMARSDLSRLKESILDDTRRAEDAEKLRQRYVEELRSTMEDERRRMESQLRAFELELRQERRLREEAEVRESRLLEDARKRQEDNKLRRAKDAETRSKFEAERKRLNEAFKINQDIGDKLRQVEPRLAQIHTELYIGDPSAAKDKYASSSSSRTSAGNTKAPSFSNTENFNTSSFAPYSHGSVGSVGPRSGGGDRGGLNGSGVGGQDEEDTFFMA